MNLAVFFFFQLFFSLCLFFLIVLVKVILGELSYSRSAMLNNFLRSHALRLFCLVTVCLATGLGFGQLSSSFCLSPFK